MASGTEKPVVDQRFMIFEQGVDDVSSESEKIIEHRPIAKIERGQSIDITVNRSGAFYYDLSRSYMKFKFKLTKANGATLTDTDKAAPINNPAFSLFQSIQFSIETEDFGRQIGTLLPFKSNLDHILFRSTEYLNSTAQSSMYFHDTPGAMNATQPDVKTGTNEGLLARYNLVKSGGLVEVRGSLPIDLADSLNSFIPNSMEIRVRLWPSSDPFVVMSSDESENYEIHILHASLCLLAITPSPRMLSEHAKQFEKQNASFYYDKSVLKSYSIPSGALEWEMDSIYSNDIPKELIIVLVNTTAFLGSQKENPFAYNHNKVTRVSYDIEGVSPKVLTPDFVANIFSESYNMLYTSATSEPGSGIVALSDYNKGYTIFRLCTVESMYRTKKGQSRLMIRFAEKLTTGITCILYAKFPAKFQVDSARNIVY